jgi:hypothetical protein
MISTNKISITKATTKLNIYESMSSRGEETTKRSMVNMKRGSKDLK